MKKRIEIDFEDQITNEIVLDAIERALRQAVETVAKWTNIRKVTVDGNVFWLPDPLVPYIGRPTTKPAKKEYPVHHEKPIVHRVPRVKR